MISLLLKIVQSLNEHPLEIFLLCIFVIILTNGFIWEKDKKNLAENCKSESPKPLGPWESLPKVSVLVAAWNEKERIENHINSFLELRYPNKELVLCAGGEDRTFQTAINYRTDNINIIKQGYGEGKQRSLKRCLKESTGDIIFLTDADCVLNDSAFELTIEPIVNKGEIATTGASMPMGSQIMHPLVLYRWASDMYHMIQQPNYVSAMLGRNCAIKRDVLVSVGGFSDEVEIGTDYYLSLLLQRSGYKIRQIIESRVQTILPTDIRSYRNKQSRWFRNAILLGIKFRDREHALPVIKTIFIGYLMLFLPFFSLKLGWIPLILWLVLSFEAVISRIRYVEFLSRSQQSIQNIKIKDYIYLPFYVLLDFIIWASTLFDLILLNRRWKW